MESVHSNCLWKLPRGLGIRRTFIFTSSCTDSEGAAQLSRLRVHTRALCVCVSKKITNQLILSDTRSPFLFQSDRYWVNFPQIQRVAINCMKDVIFLLNIPTFYLVEKIYSFFVVSDKLFKVLVVCQTAKI